MREELPQMGPLRIRWLTLTACVLFVLSATGGAEASSSFRQVDQANAAWLVPTDSFAGARLFLVKVTRVTSLPSMATRTRAVVFSAPCNGDEMEARLCFEHRSWRVEVSPPHFTFDLSGGVAEVRFRAHGKKFHVRWRSLDDPTPYVDGLNLGVERSAAASATLGKRIPGRHLMDAFLSSSAST